MELTPSRIRQENYQNGHFGRNWSVVAISVLLRLMESSTVVGELVRKIARTMQIDGPGLRFSQVASVPLHLLCLLLLMAAASILLASHGLRTVLELQGLPVTR